MKAIVCDFCAGMIDEHDRKAMVYQLSIDEAEGFDAVSAAEKRVLIPCVDVCSRCAGEIVGALQDLKRVIGNRKPAKHSRP